MIFRGAAPALVTPFTSTGEIDEPAFCRLIDRQIAAGSAALVVLGTTGENATVSPAERSRLVECAIAHVDSRVPVIIGTGNNATSESITFSREAERLGADGLLVVGPYYNKPPQAGFKAHVAAIADAVPCPIILYNVPGRTAFDATVDTILGLAEEVPTVAGVKEASGDLAKVTDIVSGRPDHFAVYAGDDELALFFMALGADGVVSVVSNVFPRRMNEIIRLGLAGDIPAAASAHFELLPAMRACFFDTNPIPVKAMLAMLGLIEPHLRLPLVPSEAAVHERVMAAIAPILERSGVASPNTELASLL